MFKRVMAIGLATALVLAAAPVMAESALDWYLKGNNTWSFEKQVEYYTKAIELAPEWAYPYNNRGVAYFNLAEFDKAKADFDMALKLKPGYKLALQNRAGANFNKASASLEAWEGSYQDRLAAGF